MLFVTLLVHRLFNAILLDSCTGWATKPFIISIFYYLYFQTHFDNGNLILTNFRLIWDDANQQVGLFNANLISCRQLSYTELNFELYSKILLKRTTKEGRKE